MSQPDSKSDGEQQRFNVLVVLDGKPDDTQAKLAIDALMRTLVTHRNAPSLTLVVSSVGMMQQCAQAAKDLYTHSYGSTLEVYTFQPLEQPHDWEAAQFAGVGIRSDTTTPCLPPTPPRQYDIVILMAPFVEILLERPAYFVGAMVYVSIGYNSALVLANNDMRTVLRTQYHLLHSSVLSPDETEELLNADTRALLPLLTSRRYRLIFDKLLVENLGKLRDVAYGVRLWHTYLGGIRNNPGGGQLTLDSRLVQATIQAGLMTEQKFYAEAAAASNFQAMQLARYIYDLLTHGCTLDDILREAQDRELRFELEGVCLAVKNLPNRDAITETTARDWQRFYCRVREQGGTVLDQIHATVAEVLLPNAEGRFHSKYMSKLLNCKTVSAETTDLVFCAGVLQAEANGMTWVKGGLTIGKHGVGPSRVDEGFWRLQHEGEFGYESLEHLETAFFKASV
jgi:hypothetical protein